MFPSVHKYVCMRRNAVKYYIYLTINIWNHHFKSKKSLLPQVMFGVLTTFKMYYNMHASFKSFYSKINALYHIWMH